MEILTKIVKKITRPRVQFPERKHPYGACTLVEFKSFPNTDSFGNYFVVGNISHF